MSALPGEKPHNEFLAGRILSFTVLLVFLGHSPGAFGQQQTGEPVQVISPPQEHTHSVAATSLTELLTEAEQDNPQIQAARQGWQLG